MKRFFFIPVLFIFFLFTGCIQIVETVVNSLSSEDFTYRCKKVSEKEYFKNDANNKKICDWLLVMYMDADNSLEASIRNDFNEVEKGLAAIRNENGSAASGYASVRVVVLWDGALLAQDSKILEVGPDTTDYYAGSETYCITNVDFITASYNEVDMSQGSTLTSFLKFVDGHYSASKGKILHVADHGSGPGKNERAMFEDKTNKGVSMSSSEFSMALENAGYGYDKSKFSALLLDVCLGASVEDSYQFKNYAEYMIASPNTTPGAGFYYVDVMKCFETELDSKAVAERIGKSFAQYYTNNPVSILSATISVIDLSKINECVEKIDDLADFIKDYKTTYVKYLQSEGNVSQCLCYKGTINWLYDIGDFAKHVYSDSSSSSDIKSKAKGVMGSLSSAIVYSWGYGLYSSESSSQSYYGIAICGNSVSNVYGYSGIPSWYRTDLTFGITSENKPKDTGWAGMLVNWFGSYPKNNS